MTGFVALCEQGVTLGRLRSMGARLALCLHPGDVVLFYGPLGAGKTTMIRAMARALGVTDPVRSPSFTIANIYAAPITVNHLDLYRLDHIQDEDSLGLEEYVAEDAVTLVEWPEAGVDRLGRPAWVVRLEHETMDTRALTLESEDPDAARRWAEAGAAAEASPVWDGPSGGQGRRA
jgi:tRNA threonylcarbamoyladenosine biosynthesis protein TsaE